MGLFQQRVLEERDQLAKRLEKLAAFVDLAAFLAIGPREKMRLIRQKHIMTLYLQVLEERICAFGETHDAQETEPQEVRAPAEGGREDSP